jgi:hypothetical protein
MLLLVIAMFIGLEIPLKELITERVPDTEKEPIFHRLSGYVSVDHLHTREIFGFDETFCKSGYRLLETPKEQRAA